MPNNPAKGQSLAEYTLIGGVIALVSIGGLMAISSSLGQQVNTMHGMFSGHGNQQDAALEQAELEALAGQTLPPQELAALAAAYPPDEAGLDALVADMHDIIETSGGSGATKVMMGYMARTAMQLEAEGELTKKQSGTLFQMANAGHQAALIQGALEKKLEKLGSDRSISQIKTSMIKIGGRKKSLNHWNNQLFQEQENVASLDKALKAQLSSTNKNVRDLKEWKAGKKELATLSPLDRFLALYDEAKKTDLMDNPRAKAVVDRLGTEILNINTQFYSTLSDDQYNTTVKQVNDKLKKTNARAWRTDEKSAGICGTGGGVDTGTYCPEAQGATTL